MPLPYCGIKKQAVLCLAGSQRRTTHPRYTRYKEGAAC
ncbi:hypothetical protein AcetOrient_orf03553 [Acetobacter orientalis]|uniref:Uncharacterized protein n=1 Tax=Acetobacter orientalis TaxID=146474 RepID=A0A2Z5ZJQ3_9PROT|nr:hypothetical protein AcetOrient_orf03553 [Acetobacter orientalis]